MGFLDNLFSTGLGEANRFNYGNYDFIKGLFMEGQDGLPGILDQSLKAGSQANQSSALAVGAAKKGVAEANRVTQQRAVEGYQSIRDLAMQAASAASQASAGSGFASSSIGGQARAQALYQGSRSSGQMGTALGGLSANIALQGGGQIAGAYGAQGQTFLAGAGQYGGFGANLAQALSQFQAVPGEAPIAALAAPLATGAGLAFGNWLTPG